MSIVMSDDMTQAGTCCLCRSSRRGCGPAPSGSREDIKASLGPMLPDTGATESEPQPRGLKYLRCMPLAASVRELRMPSFWRDVLCEVLVTFLLFFFLIGMGFNFGTVESPSQNIVVIGLGTGLYVFVLIEAFGHVQLAVMNPAVVILFVLTGKMGIIKGLFFTIAECLGSILGTALIYQCAPASVRPNFAPISIHEEMNPAQGIIVEGVITTSLVFVVAGALDDRNRKVYMPGLPIGIAVGTGILTAFHFTGGALNPVISLGPAVVTGVWKNHWIYWVGPMLGGLAATLFYHFFTYDRGFFTKSCETNEPSPSTGGADDYTSCALQADGCKADGVVWTKPIKSSSTSERLSSL